MIPSAIMLYATLAACALLIGWLVVRYDLYDREPLHMLGLATTLGALAMFLAGLLQIWIIRAATGVHIISNLELALLAGITEEAAKFAVVGLIAWRSPRFFNEPIDGLIYGSFAGLGAALEESVAVLSYGPRTSLLPLQEPVRLAGHLVMGGIGGFGVGLLMLRPRVTRWVVAASLLGAMLLHAAWDVVAFAAADTYRAIGAVRPWHTGGGIVLMLGGMVAYRQLVETGVRRTRAVFDGHAAGEPPAPHSPGI